MTLANGSFSIDDGDEANTLNASKAMEPSALRTASAALSYGAETTTVPSLAVFDASISAI